MTPPAAPAPITIKSTSVVGSNCFMGAPSMLRLAARVACGVVVAKRGFEIHGVFVSDQLPPGFILVTAVLGTGKHSDDRVVADRHEEGSFFDRRQQLDLLRGGQLGELTAGEKFLRLGLHVLESLCVERLTVAEKGRQPAVDEVDATGFARAGRVVGGNDL